MSISPSNPDAPSLTKTDMARVAAAILFSVAASVWLINEGDVRLSVLRWLLIVVTIGLLANSQSGLSAKILALASSLCSFTLFAGSSFQSFLICRQEAVLAPPLITGVNMCVESPLFITAFLTILFFVTTIGIWLSGICRPLTVDAIGKLPKYASKAKEIEKSFRALIISIGAIFVALKLVAVI